MGDLSRVWDPTLGSDLPEGTLVNLLILPRTRQKLCMFPSENFIKLLGAPLDAYGGQCRCPEAKGLSPSYLTLHLRSFEPRPQKYSLCNPQSALTNYCQFKSETQRNRVGGQQSKLLTNILHQDSLPFKLLPQHWRAEGVSLGASPLRTPGT